MKITTIASRSCSLPECDCIAVIDVLRATSSIAAAFAFGAREIRPARSVAEARRLAQSHPGSWLAGERGNLKIPGFDLGNSPLEFNASIAAKTIIMTTTNGTLALRSAARQAPHVVALAITNRSAVADWLCASAFQNVTLLCSGEHGLFSAEDMLGAGTLIQALPNPQLDDLSQVALAWANSWAANLEGALRLATHGSYLAAAGFGADLTACSAIDRFTSVPVFRNGVIRAEAEVG